MTDKPASYYMDEFSKYKTGNLVKQGGRIKTWKKRIFVLDRRNKILRYYKSPEDSIPKGVIHMEGYTVSDADDDLKKQFSFKITKDGFRTYYMIAPDEQAKNSWIQELSEAVKIIPKQSAVTISSDPASTTQTSLSYDNDTDVSDDEEDVTLCREPPRRSSQKQDEDYTLARPANMPPGRNYNSDATLVSPGPFNDPNATLIGDFGSSGYSDPNATLIGDHHSFDPNATLIGGGSLDDNATLVGDSPFQSFPKQNSKSIYMQQEIFPHIRLVPFNPFFPTIDRDVTRTLKFGRKKDEANTDQDFIGFDSKVVSRRHSEIWHVNGDFYIRDTKSQSGTFLNAMRLSLPGEESKPFKLKNGDTIQFGVDYRGSTENSAKCVSMTVEISMRRATDNILHTTTIPHNIPSGNMPNMSDLTLVGQMPGPNPPANMPNMSDLTLVGPNKS